MFSKACEYAIRAMIYVLTESGNGSKVSIKEIAKNTDAPEPFVAKVLQILSKRGIINSLKGPNGGFYIEGPAKTTSLMEIVKAVDGDKLFVSCGLGIKNCSERKPCPIHYEYKEVRDKIIKMLKENTIQELAAGLVEGEYYLIKK